jgi:hypothetical protein
MFKYAILVDKIYMCIEHIKQQIQHPREAESLKIDSELGRLHQNLKDQSLEASDLACIKIWKTRLWEALNC